MGDGGRDAGPRKEKRMRGISNARASGKVSSSSGPCSWRASWTLVATTLESWQSGS